MNKILLALMLTLTLAGCRHAHCCDEVPDEIKEIIERNIP